LCFRGRAQHRTPHTATESLGSVTITFINREHHKQERERERESGKVFPAGRNKEGYRREKRQKSI
jgi:hypothetical protein